MTRAPAAQRPACHQGSDSGRLARRSSRGEPDWLLGSGIRAARQRAWRVTGEADQPEGTRGGPTGCSASGPAWAAQPLR